MLIDRYLVEIKKTKQTNKKKLTNTLALDSGNHPLPESLQRFVFVSKKYILVKHPKNIEDQIPATYFDYIKSNV